MLKRLWLVVSGLWAVMMLWSGSTRVDGLDRLSIWIAISPFLFGVVVIVAGRWILAGRIKR